MGFVGTAVRILLTRVVPVVVVALALAVGWLNTDTDVPMGKFFATVVPILKGVWPPTIVGHGKMTGTPPVPDDMVPKPRPENERFIELPGGFSMPQAGIGMCCRPTAYDDVLVERTILWYLLLGGRHIDTAHIYLNHKAIGKGIAEAIRRGVPRSEIFVTTKLFPGHYGYNTTKETVPKFLEELGLEYLDLILMHAPSAPASFLGSVECSKLSNTQCRQETWKALSELRKEGIMRNVGVSNFIANQLEELVSMKDVAPVANNQIQFNPWLSSEWAQAAAYCHEKRISITGWNSLGGTLQHHGTHEIKLLKELAAKYQRSVAQIMLRWAMAKHVIVIPGTGNPKYMKENLSIYEFDLSPEDIHAIDELGTSKEMSAFFTMGATKD